MMTDIARYIAYIAAYCTGGWEPAGAATHEHTITYCITGHKNGVKNIIYPGQRMLFRQHHRIYAAAYPIDSIFFSHAQQFNNIT